MNQTQAGVVAAQLLQTSKQGVGFSVGLQLFALVLILLCLCEIGKQAVFYCGGLFNCGNLCLSNSFGLGFGLRCSNLGCLVAVDLLQERHNLGGCVGGPEFQRSGALEELAHTLGLFHAGEFHKDAAGAGNLLDVGLCHTKLVDTALNYSVGVVDCTLCLVAEELDDLFVGNLGFVLDIAAELVKVDVKREPLLAGHLFPSLLEEGDKVGVSLFCTLTGQ